MKKNDSQTPEREYVRLPGKTECVYMYTNKKGSK